MQKLIKLILKNLMSEDVIPGGLADNKQSDNFDTTELKKGISIEMEHTNDPEIAKEIAMDHLTEDPYYYSNHPNI